MGTQTVSVDSANDGSGDGIVEIETEEVSEEEEFSEEEEPSEEDPEEEELNEDNSEEEEPNEESFEELEEEVLGEQEVDEVASCELEPDEDSCEEVPNIQFSHKEKSNEVNSCGTLSKEAGKGNQNDEPCEEEPHEEECNEQTEESCEAVEDEEAACELAQVEEPCEEEVEETCEGNQEPCEEELEAAIVEEVEEEVEEEEVEEEVEEEEEEEEVGGGGGDEEEEEEEEEEEPEEEPFEEEPVEDPEEEASKRPSTLSQGIYNETIKSSSETISSDSVDATKSVSEMFGIQKSSTIVIAPQNTDTRVTGKKRQSKWDVMYKPNELQEDGGDAGAKKRKTRWSRWSNEDSQAKMVLPVKLPVAAIDLEVPHLHSELQEINKRLQCEVGDDRPESERSPSPEPIYNSLGLKINAREARFRAKLMSQRQKIISELVKKDPSFKPRSDYKRHKLQKRINVPVKEYPDYNFIGLILGPSGNTQKRMEKESGARILLRGKGSVREEKRKGPSDNEGLYILIEADHKYSLDLAVAMVKKLLVPVDDWRNPHKLAQLKELAELRSSSSFIKSELCDICGDTNHPTSSCPLTAPAPGVNSNVDQVNFYAEMGVTHTPFSVPPPPVPAGPSMNNSTGKKTKMVDDSKLFVGFLPYSVDDNKLTELFSPYGPLSNVNVVKDRSTGISKGYGFVKYADHIHAARAVAQMNGYRIDGKTLAVRIAGIIPSPLVHGGLSSLDQLPKYPGPAVATVHSIPNIDPMSWPGPPESKLPEAVCPFAYTRGFGQSAAPAAAPPRAPAAALAPAPAPAAALAPAPAPALAPAPASLFSNDVELAQFPGYVKSLDPPAQLYYQPELSSSLSSSSSQDYYSNLSSSNDYFTSRYVSYHMPPPPGPYL